MRVRFRIDGILQNVMAPPMKLKDAITSRIKIMAKLDISEKRLPQDGRIMIKYLKDGKKKELDFRVSTVPTLFGEKIVLRLLDKENLRLDMTKLGFEQESLATKFERQILKPYGMVLVTGPTGSGKTNTLYSSVARLNTVETNIMTAEDPGRIPAARHQPGADEGADRAELRLRSARLPAAGPQHHSGRRNPRL
jgi:type IV pilus assembly protein PilB